MALLHPAIHPPPSYLSDAAKRQGPFVSVAPGHLLDKERVPSQGIQSSP